MATQRYKGDRSVFPHILSEVSRRYNPISVQGSLWLRGYLKGINFCIYQGGTYGQIHIFIGDCFDKSNMKYGFLMVLAFGDNSYLEKGLESEVMFWTTELGTCGVNRFLMVRMSSIDMRHIEWGVLSVLRRI